jgi:hypothetical protein
MADPKTKIETQDDEGQYVSPTSDDSLSERYAKVKAQDKTLSTAERLKRLREGAKLFEEMTSTNTTKSDEA